MRDGRQASALVRMVRSRGLMGERGACQAEGTGRMKDTEGTNLAHSGSGGKPVWLEGRDEQIRARTRSF